MKTLIFKGGQGIVIEDYSIKFYGYIGIIKNRDYGGNEK
jgi:hypothetical protein